MNDSTLKRLNKTVNRVAMTISAAITHVRIVNVGFLTIFLRLSELVALCVLRTSDIGKTTLL